MGLSGRILLSIAGLLATLVVAKAGKNVKESKDDSSSSMKWYDTPPPPVICTTCNTCQNPCPPLVPPLLPPPPPPAPPKAPVIECPPPPSSPYHYVFAPPGYNPYNPYNYPYYSRSDPPLFRSTRFHLSLLCLAALLCIHSL